MLSAMDYHFLMRELSVLEGGRINKIYQDSENKNVFLFDIHVPEQGSKWLQIVIPEAMYLTDEKFTTGEPTGFCAFLRKKCSGFKIKKFEQVGFERIFKMELGTREKHVYSLYVEMFSKGNLILTEANDRIQGLLVHKNFGTRNLRGGETYKLPPSQDNTLQLNQKAFSEKLLSSEKPLVKALATDFGLGGEYAELLLQRSKTEKQANKSAALAKKLHSELKKLSNQELSPGLKEGKPSPLGDGSYNSYSSLLQELTNKQVFAQKPQVDKKAIIRESQHQKMAEYEKQAEQYQKIGEAIYQNYEKISSALNEAKNHKYPRAKKIDERHIKVEL